MIQSIGRLIAGLNAYQRPGELAAGFACGVLLGLLPGANLIWAAFFLAFSLVKINKGALLLTMIGFSALSPLVDPLFHRLGFSLLTWPALYDPFVSFAQLPLASFTRFNNTLVMGVLALALPLWVVSYASFRPMLAWYRRVIRDRFIRPKLVPWLKKLPLVKHLVVFVEAIAKAAAWQG